MIIGISIIILYIVIKANIDVLYLPLNSYSDLLNYIYLVYSDDSVSIITKLIFLIINILGLVFYIKDNYTMYLDPNHSFIREYLKVISIGSIIYFILYNTIILIFISWMLISNLDTDQIITLLNNINDYLSLSVTDQSGKDEVKTIVDTSDISIKDNNISNNNINMPKTSTEWLSYKAYLISGGIMTLSIFNIVKGRSVPTQLVSLGTGWIMTTTSTACFTSLEHRIRLETELERYRQMNNINNLNNNNNNVITEISKGNNSGGSSGMNLIDIDINNVYDIMKDYFNGSLTITENLLISSCILEIIVLFTILYILTILLSKYLLIKIEPNIDIWTNKYLSDSWASRVKKYLLMYFKYVKLIQNINLFILIIIVLIGLILDIYFRINFLTNLEDYVLIYIHNIKK